MTTTNQNDDAPLRSLEITAVVAAAAVGLVFGVVLGLVVVGPIVIGLVGALLGAGVGALVVARSRASADAVAQGDLAGAPADHVAHARLHNLVDGLCVTLGIDKPDLVVIDLPTANLAAFGSTATTTRLVVTAGLLAGLERVELEGVLARELRRVKAGQVSLGTRAAGAAVLASRVPGGSQRLSALTLGDDRVFLDDRATIEVTRYPPGLAGALAKVAALGTEVPSAPVVSAHLWLAPPHAGAQSGPWAEAPDLGARVAALREL